MFEVIDHEGNVMATVDTRLAALRKQTSLEMCTLAPHSIRQARGEAKASTLSALDVAYRTATIVWDGDILVPAK